MLEHPRNQSCVPSLPGWSHNFIYLLQVNNSQIGISILGLSPKSQTYSFNCPVTPHIGYPIGFSNLTESTRNSRFSAVSLLFQGSHLCDRTTIQPAAPPRTWDSPWVFSFPHCCLLLPLKSVSTPTAALGSEILLFPCPGRFLYPHPPQDSFDWFKWHLLRGGSPDCPIWSIPHLCYLLSGTMLMNFIAPTAIHNSFFVCLSFCVCMPVTPLKWNTRAERKDSTFHAQYGNPTPGRGCSINYGKKEGKLWVPASALQGVLCDPGQVTPVPKVIYLKY